LGYVKVGGRSKGQMSAMVVFEGGQMSVGANVVHSTHLVDDRRPPQLVTLQIMSNNRAQRRSYYIGLKLCDCEASPPPVSVKFAVF